MLNVKSLAELSSGFCLGLTTTARNQDQGYLTCYSMHSCSDPGPGPWPAGPGPSPCRDGQIPTLQGDFR